MPSTAWTRRKTEARSSGDISSMSGTSHLQPSSTSMPLVFGSVLRRPATKSFFRSLRIRRFSFSAGNPSATLASETTAKGETIARSALPHFSEEIAWQTQRRSASERPSAFGSPKSSAAPSSAGSASSNSFCASASGL